MRRLVFDKWLVLFLSLLLIFNNCSTPSSRITKYEPKFLIPDLAQKIADNSTPVRIADMNDIYKDCLLLGWFEDGFIICTGDKIDTLGLDSLGFKIMVNTGKSKRSKGAKIGLLVGCGLSALNYLLAHNSGKKYKGGDWENIWKLQVLFLTPLIMGIATMVGAEIGTAHFEYDNYTFDKNYFAKNPWLSMRYYQKAAVNELHKEDNKTK